MAGIPPELGGEAPGPMTQLKGLTGNLLPKEGLGNPSLCSWLRQGPSHGTSGAGTSSSSMVQPLSTLSSDTAAPAQDCWGTSRIPPGPGPRAWNLLPGARTTPMFRRTPCASSWNQGHEARPPGLSPQLTAGRAAMLANVPVWHPPQLCHWWRGPSLGGVMILGDT